MPRPDERVDEGMIHAWLDGELSADEAARVERLVAENAEWAAAAAEARGLVAASSRILSALDVVAGDVIPRGGSAAPLRDDVRASKPDIAPKVASRRAIATWARVAAGAVLVAGVAYMSRTATETARVAEVGARSEDVAAATAIASEPVAADAPALNKEAERGIAADAAAPKRGDAPSAPSRAAEKTAPAAVSAPAPQAAVADAVMPPPPEAKITVAPLASAAPEPAQQEVRGVAGGVARGAAASRAESRSLRLATTGQNTIEGCWRIETTARADSIQRALPIVRISGDTTFTVLTPNGISAWVLRDSGNVLRGRTRDASGTPAAFRAVRWSCPP